MEDLQKWFLYDFDIGQKKLNPVIIIIIIIITYCAAANFDVTWSLGRCWKNLEMTRWPVDHFLISIVSQVSSQLCVTVCQIMIIIILPLPSTYGPTSLSSPGNFLFVTLKWKLNCYLMLLPLCMNSSLNSQVFYTEENSPTYQVF